MNIGVVLLPLLFLSAIYKDIVAYLLHARAVEPQKTRNMFQPTPIQQ
jgi:hypothetical protein